MTMSLAKPARATAASLVEVVNPFDGSIVGKVRLADEVAVADALRRAIPGVDFGREGVPATEGMTKQ